MFGATADFPQIWAKAHLVTSQHAFRQNPF